jgi:hypothetical protein
MAKFNVYASFVSYSEIEIEAENKEQAYLLAKDMDGALFTHSGYGDWNIDEVVEIE